MRYLPHTPHEIEEMLQVVGASSLDELFQCVPPVARFEGKLNVPDAVDEAALMRLLHQLAEENRGANWLSFLGAGLYSHHIPPAVDQLLLRSEFYTAYTPYQPEVAQGTLQVIWEFQTIVSELFGLPLANASMYDGASAAAEAGQMARRLTKRERVIVCGSVHPDYRAVIRTYLSGQNPDAYVEVPAAANGTSDRAALLAHLDETTAACVVGYPSFVGGVSELASFAEELHARDTLLISSTSEPYALGVLEAPGALGVDIATGEGQALATAPNLGGPGVGLFACRDDRKYLQQLPGRVCGETVDREGRRGFVLTLSTREQHIRRERATSNICTNQGLIALALTIRASLLGKTGFQSVAQNCLSKARYLERQITALDGYHRAFEAPYFNEFAISVRGGSAEQVCRSLQDSEIVAGLDLGRVHPDWKDRLLIAVTEQHRREDLDRFVAALDRV